MRITHLPAAARRARPWKNGGGRTWDVAACPDDGGLDGFEWRISMARVEADGPFSRFPGIVRTLAVLEGALWLHERESSGVRLDPDSPPWRFDGDVPVRAEVIAPVLDLNLMHDAGRCSASLRRIDRGEACVEAPVACFVAPAALRLAWTGRGAPASHLDLQAHDAVRLDDATGMRLRWPAAVPGYLVQLAPPPR